MLAGPPAGANVPRPFSLSSEQLNPGAYSSGMGNTGLGATQPLSLASDEIDMPLDQIFRSCLFHLFFLFELERSSGVATFCLAC